MARPGTKADRLSAAIAEGSILSSAEPLGDHADKDCLPDRASPPRPPVHAEPSHGVTPEEAFLRSVPVLHRKQFGQFFTPQPIAELMCDWLAGHRPETLLDPAAGPGIFVRTLRERGFDGRIVAIDKDPLAVAACSQATNDLANVTVKCADFLLWDDSFQFDAIIANPPYVRHHDLHYDRDIFAEIGKRNGIRLSRLTNVYGLFILEICRRLKEGGRAAIIVPGEWLNANFGIPLKQFLLNQQLLKHLVYFSHAEAIFADALTTACLLFVAKPASRREGAPSVHPPSTDSVREEFVQTVFVHSAQSLAPLRRTLLGDDVDSPSLTTRRLSHPLLLGTAKWNALLEHGTATIPDGFVPLEQLVTTRRGIATGANQFFHVSLAALHGADLTDDVGRPCVGRAADVRGYVFTAENFRQLEEADKRTRLLCFREPLTEAARRYLAEGARLGLPKRYLLAARNPWYAMETRPPSPIWAAVFGRTELRFIWNEAGVQNLTTFHCVYPRQLNTRQVQALVACLNSAWVRELAGNQQRVYGGGLLKYEPRDLLRIPVPDLRSVSRETVDQLAELLPALNAARPNPKHWNEIQRPLREAVRQAAREAANARKELANS